MRHVKIIGIGTGNPEHLTVQAVRVLNACDKVFIPGKGDEKAALADVRREILERYLERPAEVLDYTVPPRQPRAEGYEATVEAWHDEISDIFRKLLLHELEDEETAGFLVWGDPGLYDSTIRILDRLRETHSVDFDHEVVPGITSIQALTAAHKIPLNEIGLPVLVTTGRRLAADFFRAERAIVMLDGEEAFAKLDDEEALIWWGAYLGMPQQIIISGRLGAVKNEIVETRRQARQREGWIMDVYLLQKTPSTTL